MTKRERALFRIAKHISELSNHPQHKVGAVVYLKHQVISTGANSNTKCSGMQAVLDVHRFSTFSPGKVHAEVQALSYLVKSKVDLTRAEIFTYRETKDGHLALARPCPACMALIKSCGIKKIYYTTYDGYACEEI